MTELDFNEAVASLWEIAHLGSVCGSAAFKAESHGSFDSFKSTEILDYLLLLRSLEEEIPPLQERLRSLFIERDDLPPITPDQPVNQKNYTVTYKEEANGALE